MKKYDIAVIGGGFAGTAAAIAAAREGAEVILVEKGNCLGGAACSALVNPFMPYWTDADDKKTVLSRGIFEKILSRMKELEKEISGKTYPEGHCLTMFHEEYLKIVLNRMVAEAGAEVLFHSSLTGADCEEGEVKSVTLSGKSGNHELFADYFIDATGDADLTFMSGFPCRLGRDGDSLCQPMTLCFRVSGVDKDKFRAMPRENMNELYKRFQSEGKIKNPREDVLIFNNIADGVFHFNSTRVVKLNPTDPFDLTKAELEAREQTLELFLFMKNNIPGFENSHLLMTASEIGVRESRMIDGEYLLTGDDLKSLKKFDDAIAYGCYSIDIHNPEGTGTTLYHFGKGEYYSIPYRALIPKGAVNLLTAGRCISADHTAQSAIRIMPTVCCIGEAAGAAAAAALRSKCPVGKTDVSELLAVLKKNGAAIF